MIEALALGLAQVVSPVAMSVDERSAAIALKDFRSAQSDCVVLASGRIVPGISVTMPGPAARYLPVEAKADALAALPASYRTANFYQINRMPILGSSPSGTSPVWIAWEEDKRLCAVVAESEASAGDATGAAREILNRYGFRFDKRGAARVTFPANPAVMAPSANLFFFPDEVPQDKVLITRVEHRE